MKKLIILLFVAQATLFSHAQVKQGVEAIDSLTVVAQIEFLASDNMKGRLTGSDENKIVADYISSEFVRLGYVPRVQKFRAEDRDMQNVFIEIPGEDTTEIIVVGAHYDHLGMAAYGDAYNGADDNASGVAAVLQIARAIQASGLQPKRTIILALWDGEEIGLHGSKHYVATHEDISRVKGYMNFDMIGRNTDETKPKLVRYLYNENKPEYRKYLEHSIDDYDLELEVDFRAWDNPTSGSDNASFAKAGVPIAWYHTDGHADYHKPTDTADKLNWSKLMDIIRSSYVVSWQMAME